MSNPISRMTDETRLSIIESLHILELDWYSPDTRMSELFKALKDSVLSEDWDGIRNFIQETRSAVSTLQEYNSRSPEVDDTSN
jgi:hypothetical protein